MVSSVISAEAHRFCQTTSVRGIPRIVNSKSIVHSIIWLLAVLTCTSVLVWQVATVFIRYRSYPVNSIVNQSPEWDNTTFPDITICNLCSLVYEDEMPISYAQYVETFFDQYTRNDFQNIYGLFEADVNTTLEEYYYQYVLNTLCSPASYFLNFPIERDATKVPSDLPILDCSYFNWDYTPQYNYNCFGSIQEIWDPDYYKCFTLKLNDSLRKNTRGFSAIIYVEDILDNIWLSYVLDLRNTRGTGMKVLIHEPGSKPDMKLGIGIETGKSTTINLQQTKLSRLPTPYSNCTSQLTLEPVDESPLYTQAFCMDVCLQEQYLKNCGCLLNIYQYTADQLERANNSVCGDIGITTAMSKFNWYGVEQMLCTINVTENRRICHSACPLPCNEYHYEPRITSSSWPHVTSQLSFYLTYINGTRRFGDKFNKYMFDYEYNFYNHTAALRVLNALNKEGLIQDSFLQLNVQFDSNAYQQEAEAVAFSVDAFGAQIGGVLSLWLGVTILLIFEILEFIISLISSIWSVKRNQDATRKERVESIF